MSHPLLQDKFTGLRDQLNEFGGFVVGLVKNQQQQRGAHSYRNAFDVPRKSLLDQVMRMRANFLQPGLLHTKLLDDDYVHSMPLAQMGNYQEYLKRMTPPLREIESVPVRQHMFGNYLINLASITFLWRITGEQFVLYKLSMYVCVVCVYVCTVYKL